jgi:hypothetical protein
MKGLGIKVPTTRTERWRGLLNFVIGQDYTLAERFEFLAGYNQDLVGRLRGIGAETEPANATPITSHQPPTTGTTGKRNIPAASRRKMALAQKRRWADRRAAAAAQGTTGQPAPGTEQPAAAAIDKKPATRARRNKPVPEIARGAGSSGS